MTKFVIYLLSLHQISQADTIGGGRSLMLRYANVGLCKYSTFCRNHLYL